MPAAPSSAQADAPNCVNEQQSLEDETLLKGHCHSDSINSNKPTDWTLHYTSRRRITSVFLLGSHRTTSPQQNEPQNTDIILFFSQPSSIRGLSTPRTYFLHLPLSSVILTDSSMGSHVQDIIRKYIYMSLKLRTICITSRAETVIDAADEDSERL